MQQDCDVPIVPLKRKHNANTQNGDQLVSCVDRLKRARITVSSGEIRLKKGKEVQKMHT